MWVRSLAVMALIAGALVTALRPGSASATGAGAGSCSALSPAAVAKDLGQRSAQQTGSSSVPSGSGSGEVSATCRYIAWTGSLPTTAAQALAKEKSGTVATLAITDQLLDAGDPNALQESWAQGGYQHYLNAAVGAANTISHGHHFATPSDGAATAVGYQSVKGGARELIGIWSNFSDYGLITITVTVGKPKHGVSEINRVAAGAVPAGI